MSIKSSLLRWTLGKQCPMEEISENEAYSFEDKCTFLSPFHSLSNDFDMDSHNFHFDILRNK